MRARRHSLRTRIVLTIIGSVIATSLIFGLAAFAIAYTMEDRLFTRALAGEVAHQQAAWQRTGALSNPLNPDVAVYRAKNDLPPDIRAEFAANPIQTEFFGKEGRHYHIRRFDLNGGAHDARPEPAIAVTEVSRDLLVRPYRDSIIIVLALMSLFIALFMAAIALWLINQAMRPLTRLAQDVANVAATVPAIRAESYPANEIGVLAEALEQAFARISGFVDRERVFTRDASHELRTPLAVVRGAADIMAVNQNFPAELAEALRRIDTATTDMALALDQLLALAREGEGVVKDEVLLRPMIDKAVIWARMRYPASAMDMAIGIGPDETVRVHQVSLQLVLNNLIGNCFQHVGTGRLAIDLRDNQLTITDEGPGLPVGSDPFLPFAKGKASAGSGLGLDISRRLCDAAGMTLTAGRGPGGRGAQFRLGLGSA